MTDRELPYDPLFISRYLSDEHIALFIIAKIWILSVHQWIGEWIMKIWEIYTTEYYSAIKKKKKEWNLVVHNNADGPQRYYVKWSQMEKHKYCMISLICGILKK